MKSPPKNNYIPDAAMLISLGFAFEREDDVHYAYTKKVKVNHATVTYWIKVFNNPNEPGSKVLMQYKRANAPTLHCFWGHYKIPSAAFFKQLIAAWLGDNRKGV